MRGLFRIAVSVAALAAQEPPAVTFGTTVASTSGLRGDIYLLRPDDEMLPNFKRMKPVGTIYTTSLNISPRAFNSGFPGITQRFEWFGIDYNGRIWIEQAGRYRFELLADDGAKLSIDGALVIDNDGLHTPLAVSGSAHLTRGVHRIQVGYFQGPRFEVALILRIAGPGQSEWRVFDTNDFPPPPDPKDWVNGAIREVKRGSNW